MQGFMPRGVAAAMAAGEASEAPRRSQRSHGLQIFNEDLLWELHGEMMEPTVRMDKATRAHNGEEDGEMPLPKRLRPVLLAQGAANGWEDSDDGHDYKAKDPNAKTAEAVSKSP